MATNLVSTPKCHWISPKNRVNPKDCQKRIVSHKIPWNWCPLAIRDPTAGPLRGWFGGLPCASALREPLGRPVVRTLCTLCGAMWGETMWQTQASTYIATSVKRRLGKHIDRNHGGLFQKRHSMDWMDCSQKSSGLPRYKTSETGQFGVIHPFLSTVSNFWHPRQDRVPITCAQFQSQEQR